jgi:DeoR/GlpR family transcriptional regulator of sugar metabolism
MDTLTRQKLIQERLAEKGILTYQDLAGLFGASTMTIRRDAEVLCRKGAALKVPGGLRRIDALPYNESPIASRLDLQRAEKRAIAREAAGLVSPGLTLYLDGGTTSIELADRLAEAAQGLTIVSNSALVCFKLARGRNTVLAIGGQLDPSNLCFVGPMAEEAASRFFVDLAFFSTKGFVPAEGTFESSEPTFRIKQLIARQCRRAVLLADHTKFGQRALCRVLTTSQIHVVITDRATPKKHRSLLASRGIEVRVAGAGAPVEAVRSARKNA